MTRLPLLLVVLSAGICVGQQTDKKDCSQGQYRSMDGRCLKDHTGEARPAGDGCNTMTCTDPACRYGVATAMACIHPDDPADRWSISSGVLSVPLPKKEQVPAPKPAPLKCGTYEHIAYTSTACLSDGCWDATVPPYCVPDLHTVTEKEWQELMSRLKALEQRPEIKFSKPGEVLLPDCSKEPNHCIVW